MRLSIWKCRPSPCQTKLLLVLCLIFVCCRLVFISTKSIFTQRYNGPQTDTRDFFPEDSAVKELPLVQKSEKILNLTQIRMQLFANDEPNSFNLHQYYLSNGIIIAIQVHDRPQFYSILIDSLRVAQDIDKIDLVISHDIWSDEMDALTRSIDFCRVHQIYFPLSANFYDGEYPGDSASDCTWNIARGNQANSDCIGSEDLYGHFREARIVNIKHHWWWKLNRIKSFFQKSYSYLILLEEDHAVTPDFLHITNRLETFSTDQNGKLANPELPFLMTLGTYKAKLTTVKDDWQTVASASFNSGKHNMGMILSKELVDILTSDEYTEAFCEYDDYNWDFSLFHTVLVKKPMRVFYPLMPRVFHLGDACGVHHKSGNCDVANVNAFRNQIHEYRYFLFPSSFLHLRRLQELRRNKLKPNGGWGDKRDRQLCRLFQTQTLPSQLITDRLNFL